MSSPAASAGSPRRILLVDADAFFVAVARMADPEGAGRAKLLIVGGSAASRGVVCSASYEARKFGVRSGMPISRAVRLCPQAMCVPVPRKCGEMSRAIGAVLARWAPVVAPASIDEWYLDMGGTEGIYGGESLAATAARMREAVREQTSLSVSIGGGTNRLVAKLAVELAKPKPGTGATGVHVVEPGDEARFMTRFALGDIPGIGPKAQERLERIGLRTVPDVLRYERAQLARLLGADDARWLLAKAHGIDDSPVAEREEVKSMGREDTFPTDLHEERDLERELQRLAIRVAADLRGDGLRARTVTVTVRDADFVTRQASRTLDAPVESDRAIARVAKELLAKLRRARRVGVRLLGVRLSQLGVDDRAERQLGLFAGTAEGETPAETERDRALSQAVDRLRARFGDEVVIPGTLLPPKR